MKQNEVLNLAILQIQFHLLLNSPNLIKLNQNASLYKLLMNFLNFWDKKSLDFQIKVCIDLLNIFVLIQNLLIEQKQEYDTF